MLTPKETMGYVEYASIGRVNKSFADLLFQGMLAGMFIAFGAMGYFKVVAHTQDPGMAAFLGALIFPTGIIAILMTGAELFTSNCMATLGVANKKFGLLPLLRLLAIVLLANYLGTLLMAWLVAQSGIFTPEMLHKVVAVVEKKAHLPLMKMLMSGIICNVVVCAAVYMTYPAKDAISKVWIIWFPIAVFVLNGSEHIVANMFYFNTAILAGGLELSLAEILTSFGMVTIGNIIGGGIVFMMLAKLAFQRHAN